MTNRVTHRAQQVNYPRLVKAVREVHMARVAAGGTHTLLLAASGEVFSCGDGTFGGWGGLLWWAGCRGGVPCCLGSAYTCAGQEAGRLSEWCRHRWAQGCPPQGGYAGVDGHRAVRLREGMRQIDLPVARWPCCQKCEAPLACSAVLRCAVLRCAQALWGSRATRAAPCRAPSSRSGPGAWCRSAHQTLDLTLSSSHPGRSAVPFVAHCSRLPCLGPSRSRNRVDLVQPR